MKFDFWLIFHWFSLLFRKSGCFKSYQWTLYLIKKVFTHTHTHTLHKWSNLCKNSIYREFLYWLNFELSFISRHIFEMLSDCFISWLYMYFLELILGKIFFMQIFLQCEASGRSLLASRRVQLRRSNSLVTRPDARGHVACLCGNARLDGLVIRLDRHPTGLKIAFSPNRRISLALLLS